MFLHAVEAGSQSALGRLLAHSSRRSASSQEKKLCNLPLHRSFQCSTASMPEHIQTHRKQIMVIMQNGHFFVYMYNIIADVCILLQWIFTNGSSR